MAEEGHIPPRNNGRKEVSAPMEYRTPSEILPVEMTQSTSPYSPVYLYLLVFWLFFSFLFEQALLQWLFQYLFKPKGAGTFFYSFKFYGETFRLCCVITTERLLPTVDGPHRGSRTQSTKWTDPTRVKLIQIHKVDRLHQGSRPVHKVDGPDQGHKLIQIHKVDRLHQGSRPQSTKWTGPTRVKLIQIHKVDGLYQGSRPKSTKWTAPTRVTNFHKIRKVDGFHQGSRPVHKVDGPSKGKKLKYPKVNRPSIKTHVHYMDGPNKGQNSRPRRGRTQLRSNLFKWTDPTKGLNPIP